MTQIACDNDIGKGYTALMWAAEKGCTDIVKVLINSKTNVNTPGSNSALERAAREGYIETTKLLLDNGAYIKQSQTALVWAQSNINTQQDKQIKQMAMTIFLCHNFENFLSILRLYKNPWHSFALPSVLTGEIFSFLGVPLINHLAKMPSLQYLAKYCTTSDAWGYGAGRKHTT